MANPDTQYAFPHSYPAHVHTVAGMTLRDYFAGQALMGMLAGRSQVVKFTPEDAAISAYFTADAMLAERSITPTED